MRAVPIVLLAACCLILLAVRIGALLQTVLSPPAAPRDAAAVSQESARAAQRRHASAILAAAADFVDVTMLAVALALLLRYSYGALPQLRLQPDPLVSPVDLCGFLNHYFWWRCLKVCFGTLPCNDWTCCHSCIWCALPWHAAADALPLRAVQPFKLFLRLAVVTAVYSIGVNA